MNIVERIDLALNSEYAVMSDDHRTAMETVLKWIKEDREINQAIKLLKAVMAIDKYEHDFSVEQGYEFAILFSGICDEINDDPSYDMTLGSLPDLIIKAGELVKNLEG